jgi:hypothetical protein
VGLAIRTGPARLHAGALRRICERKRQTSRRAGATDSVRKGASTGASDPLVLWAVSQIVLGTVVLSAVGRVARAVARLSECLHGSSHRWTCAVAVVIIGMTGGVMIAAGVLRLIE